METRYNPFWFDDNGVPSENLELAFSSLKCMLKLKFRELFKPFDFEAYSYCVEGSVARGNWRSEEDIINILELTGKMRTENHLDKEDLEYLAIFYSQKEITNYFFDQEHRYYLKPGRLYLSDLDLKVHIDGRKIKKKFNIDVLEVDGLKANNLWSGLIEVYYSTVLQTPRYSLNERKWILPEKD